MTQARKDYRDVLAAVNNVCGGSHRIIDTVSERELLVTYAAVLLEATDAKVFYCRPNEALVKDN